MPVDITKVEQKAPGLGPPPRAPRRMTGADDWDDEIDVEDAESVPEVDRLCDTPDPDRTWVHADGLMHEDPPLPVARVSWHEAGHTLPVFGVGYWPAVEAPACGAVLDVPAEATPDGQRRRFMCDRPVGHTDSGNEPHLHRTVTWNLTPNGGGHSFPWTDEWAVKAAAFTATHPDPSCPD